MQNQVIENEVFIEKTFNASPDKVFGAWTDPEKLLQWYAPDGCTVRFKHISVEPGGKFHSCISNPEFGDCWAIGEYKEIIPNKKLIFSMMNADQDGNPIDPKEIGMDSEWPRQTLVTVKLTAEGGKTRMQLWQTVSQKIAIKTGAYPSWLQMFGHMEALLQQN
jgi:uncharacterized protein YndB with AHSA1/START domain